METRDHGGGLDAVIAQYGGRRETWIDLSTGINPQPYPLGDIPHEAWTALPDTSAQAELTSAARAFWRVPDGVEVLAAPGASVLIANLPRVIGAPGLVHIAQPTYNEWEAAFRQSHWTLAGAKADRSVEVYVHPNNPNGALAPPPNGPALRIYDESFADCLDPSASFVPRSDADGSVILKSVGKFWGLAGLRLGFLLGPADVLARMAEALGPWPVSGPALLIGARALRDQAWAAQTRNRLTKAAARLDALMAHHCAKPQGTTLFRLYRPAGPAADLKAKLARHHILSRTFPYDPTLLRLGLPGCEAEWHRLEKALS